MVDVFCLCPTFTHIIVRFLESVKVFGEASVSCDGLAGVVVCGEVGWDHFRVSDPLIGAGVLRGGCPALCPFLVHLFSQLCFDEACCYWDVGGSACFDSLFRKLVR